LKSSRYDFAYIEKNGCFLVRIKMDWVFICVCWTILYIIYFFQIILFHFINYFSKIRVKFSMLLINLNIFKSSSIFILEIEFPPSELFVMTLKQILLFSLIIILWKACFDQLLLYIRRWRLLALSPLSTDKLRIRCRWLECEIYKWFFFGIVVSFWIEWKFDMNGKTYNIWKRKMRFCLLFW
jgi:hypothetical protein